MTTPSHPWAPAVKEAMTRASELRTTWLETPGNHAPPKGSPPELYHLHHARWRASKECAHAEQLIRAAVDSISQ